jgi:hypothetical protein
MKTRVLVIGASLAASAALSLGLATGCSSSSGGSSPPAGHDGGTASDTGTGADTASGTDSGGGGGADAGMESSPGEHDGAAPDALYGCAAKGSFGWPCTVSASGPDPTDCTDPNFPDCFVGGQGSWCTKTCTGTTDCTGSAEDAGCAPESCNTKGYCK